MNAPYPYHIGTADACKKLDADTIQTFGIDGFTLMEVAGSTASGHLLGELRSESHGLYLCGKGNNAGDALVVARYLLNHGIRATVLLLSGEENLSSETAHNLALLKKMAGEDSGNAGVHFINGWNDPDLSSPDSFDFIIDGMLGTGLTNELKGNYIDAVDWANRSGLPVYAMDIPTGLHADTGSVMGAAIVAKKTFSFGILKQGFYLNSGHDHTGEVVYCELPFPNYLKSFNTFLLHEKWLKEPSHDRVSHKYEAGILYIVAGSEGLTGAALLAAMSAWAEGPGAVILISPGGILPVFENNLPQIIKKPVGRNNDMYFHENHLDAVLAAIADKPGKVLFGPGIGRKPETLRFAADLLKEYQGDLVVDADGLRALSEQDNWSKPKGSEWILTPHPGELSALLDADINDGKTRLDLVRKLSTDQKITVVSKGLPVITGTPDGKCYLTGYDTRMFARAGFGDVLAGKIGARWAIGRSSIESAALSLIRGYQKARSIEKENPGFLEPLDLI